ncbi:MAG: ribonucleoside triphosphate reductase [Candidatus Nealsonbacteria bacterium]|nr:MAG: ribonucleoside triphosphate reductase [Candidatus Nealsonbacteria bacterium]
MQQKIKKVRKRDGTLVDFDQSRITGAIFKALTATGQGDGELAQKLSDKVLKILLRRFREGEVPHVEQIQDIVEEVLILEGLVKTAKAYILYREQRRRIREAVKYSEEAVERLDQYLGKLDWEVQENANMAFSLQGLNHYGVSYIIKRYWLNKIYPPEIREANESGDLHLHNLDTLGCYCMGWDLYDLLLKGFRGVPGKVETKPAKHFRAALGQVVNFMYTLQGEAAGAIAFSNFDTLLAPFIRYDNLDYPQVKQALQEFLFNMAVPTRVGFQCVSQDTEILTPEGWKTYDEVKKGDEIRTLNLETKEIENKKVKFVFKREYKGMMYRLKNRIQDQLISPEHRVLRKKFDTQKYVLEPIEKVLKLKSPIIIPIAGKNTNPEAEISDEQIKLMAWIISEGTVEHPGKHRCCYRISIYQSKIKNSKHYNEIINLLRHFKLKYSESIQKGLGDEVQRIRLDAESSRKIHQWFGTRENVHFIPNYLLNLSERQSRLFLKTYLKGDGTEDCKIASTDLELLDDLQHIIVNAGYGFTVLKRKPTIGKKDIYILRIIRHPETYISKIEKVNYKGIIWCPHTENGTIIARRKGKVFITGNCPFTNITLDLKPSPVFATQPVIIGGKPQKETYGEFEEEMKMFDRALYEVYMEGDRNGRPFHFPIPTINITKDFPWEEPAFNGIFEASAKYGINYFANYINSEMKPEDVRSMCCRLRLNLTELYNRGGGGLFGSGSLTGSIGVVTVNMPRIGYLSKTKKEFFARLGKIMDLARDSLEIKRKTIENFIEKGLYPYSKFYLSGVKKARGAYYANHFSTIGLVGMNECLLNFLGENIASEKGRKFALEVMDFMRERLVKYQEETGNIYNLEATPAESTAYRLALKDKEKYPDIITAGTKEVPYYTNSTQLPVNYTDDIFEALKLQDELQCKYTGGTVLHLFLGERIQDIETVKKLIKKIFENFHLPYITLTPTFSICPVHGYLAGEHWTCPKCTIKQPCEVYSRVVGYLRPVQQWNKGKAQEFKERKEFKIPL